MMEDFQVKINEFNQLLNQNDYQKLFDDTSTYLLFNPPLSLVYCYRSHARSRMKDLIGCNDDFTQAIRLIENEIYYFSFPAIFDKYFLDYQIKDLWKSSYDIFLFKKKRDEMKNFYKTSCSHFFVEQKPQSKHTLDTIYEETEDEDKLDQRCEYC